jgi:hypothetical protein
MESQDERVQREDLHLFINAGLTATGQGGYYHGSLSERLSLAFLHSYIAINYSGLYTLCLAAGLNDHNAAHAIFTLLKSGAPENPNSRAKANLLLKAAVKALPPQRAYKLFERLARARVNNRRTRALIKDYILGRRDPAFDAIKYRRRMKVAALHAHVPLPSEVSRFLFEGAKGKPYSILLLETYRQARYDNSAIFRLPFSVAQGLAEQKGIDRETFMKRIQPMMTEREKLRAQNSGAGAFDSSRVDLVELCVYFLRSPREERQSLFPKMLERARRQASDLDLPRDLRVATVLDRSRSSFGNSKGRRRPLALALAVHLLVEARCPAYRAYWSWPTQALLDLHPRGHTSLAEPLLKALEERPDFIILVSDGRENAPRGGCEAIAQAMIRKLPEQAPGFLHLNPVFNPDDFMPMSLGSAWPTIGVAKAKDLGTALAFARFAQGGRAEELTTYLEQKAESFVHAIR